MSLLPLPPLGVIAFAVSMLALTACTSASNQPAASVTIPIVTPVIIPPVITDHRILVHGDGCYLEPAIDALRVYPTVVIGRVEDMLQHFDPRPGYLGVPQSVIDEIEAMPPGKGGPIPPEMLTRPPGSGTSMYSVRVLTEVAGEGPEEGQMFAIVQPGGVFENVAYENLGDPVLLPGSTYLFFLKVFNWQASGYHLPEGYENLPSDFQRIYLSAPAYRYLVDGQLKDVDPTRSNDDCFDLSLVGLTAYDAITLIRASDKRG